MKEISSRTIGLSIIICLLMFLIFILISFAMYPGGSIFDPMAKGHSFWQNFWCDILAKETLNDVPNASRPFAVIAGFCVISGLLIIGIYSERFFSIPKNQYRLMLGTGVLSIFSASGLNFYHDIFLIFTASSAFLSFLIFIFYSLQTTHKWFSLLGVLAFITGGINFVLWLQDHQTIFLPFIQKVSTMFFIGWMLLGGLILIKDQ